MELDTHTWVSMPVKSPGFYAMVFVTQNELDKNKDSIKELIELKLRNAKLSLYDTIGIDE